MVTRIIFEDDIVNRFDQLLERLAGIETQLAGLRDDMNRTFNPVPIISSDSVNWYEDKTIAPKKDTTPNTDFTNNYY